MELTKLFMRIGSDYEFTLESEKLIENLLLKMYFLTVLKNWLSSETLPKQPLKSLSKRLFTGKPHSNTLR